MKQKKFNISCVISGGFYIAMMFIFCSCQNPNENKYFYDLTRNLEKVQYDRDSVKVIEKKEQLLFHQTGNRKFEIAAKYVSLFYYSEPIKEYQLYDNDIKQIPLVFNLKNLNAGRYDFIVMACDLNLALKFENSSPSLAMKYIDSALISCKRMREEYFIGHLYHAKGRLLYKMGNYGAAGEYFRKALSKYDRDELLFKASMYNNLAMVDEKAGQNQKAIKNVRKAILMLSGKNTLEKNESSFLVILRHNLGTYLLNDLKYSEAQQKIENIFLTEKKRQVSAGSIDIAEKLLRLYKSTGQNSKNGEVTKYLETQISEHSDIRDQIRVAQILLNYYIDEANIEKIRFLSTKLKKLNDQFNNQSTNSLNKLTDTLNISVIQNLEENYQRTQKASTVKYYTLVLLAVMIIIIILMAAKIKRERLKKLREIAEKNKELLEKQNSVLMQERILQDMKIQTLHSNLSLKIQTEKAFLDQLKQIKKTSKTSSEEIIKGLLFQITSLLKIDARDHSIFTENDENVRKFSEKLLTICPDLTPKELKLCLYFRMDITTKEVAILLNSTDGTIRVYKTKIRNKLNLDKEKDLTQYLKTL